MPPLRSKKRKSSTDISSIASMQDFPAPPTTTVPTKLDKAARTPTRNPNKRPNLGITYEQKQALIDNLQLESKNFAFCRSTPMGYSDALTEHSCLVTERARKLRAQYALQSQTLRSRIEIRVNRIPMALRRANMGELLAQYQSGESRKAGLASGKTLPQKASPKGQAEQKHSHPDVDAQPARTRGTKRSRYDLLRTSGADDKLNDLLSDEFSSSSSKENGKQEEIFNPKKRTKTTAKVVAPARVASRSKTQAVQVLSPRSSNSQTLPRSPARPPFSPAKSMLARPVSPVKMATAAASRMGSKTKKSKKEVMVTSKATAPKRAPAKPATKVEAPVAGRRVLRKRI